MTHQINHAQSAKAYALSMTLTLAGLIMLPLSQTSAATSVQPISSADKSCKPTANGGAALVSVPKLKDVKGDVRVELYRNDPENFLKRAGRELRIELPANVDGFSVCVRSEKRDRYAIVVIHDRKGTGKFDAFNDGVGLSHNPKLGRSRPPIDPALIDFGETTLKVPITMNYLRGFSMRPIG